MHVLCIVEGPDGQIVVVNVFVYEGLLNEAPVHGGGGGGHDDNEGGGGGNGGSGGQPGEGGVEVPNEVRAEGEDERVQGND